MNITLGNALKSVRPYLKYLVFQNEIKISTTL